MRKTSCTAFFCASSCSSGACSADDALHAQEARRVTSTWPTVLCNVTFWRFFGLACDYHLCLVRVRLSSKSIAVLCFEMSKRSTRSTRAVSTVNAEHEDVKPDIQQLSTLTFQPFSRTHRAQLHDLVGQTALKPTVSFCSSWATSHNVDPAAVGDWVQRRSGGSRKENIAGRRTKVAPRATGKVSGAIRESTIDVRIKRERAESPVLPPPPTKKIKTRRDPPTAASELFTKSSTATGTRPPTRHTRAHDVDPHPACPTCAQKIPVSAGSAVQDSSAAHTRALKSALRHPASVSRRPRQVRFSDGLSGVDDRAYIQPEVSKTLENSAYTQSTPSLCTTDSSPVLPPRFKRKMMISGNALVDSLPTRAVANTRVAFLKVSSTDPQSWSAIPTSALRSGAHGDVPEQDVQDVDTRTTSPKRRKLTHALSTLLSTSPLVDPRPVALAPPRTPSPQVQVKVENSFFSPNFFSDSSRTSSPLRHSDDELALPTSSPPTSPPPPLSPKIASPTPSRPLPSLPFAMEHVPPANARTPAPMSTALVSSPSPVTPLAALIESPGPGSPSLPPPQDIPHPSRTPPCPDGPGSRPTTPQPRPSRPIERVHCARNTIADPDLLPPPADIPPRGRTPPCPDGPGSGSRPGTPQPRPVRPVHIGVRLHPYVWFAVLTSSAVCIERRCTFG